MADGSDLLLDFNPTGVSDNPAGRQLLLAALLHQDRSTQWEAHFGSIERVTGGNACGTDQLAGAWLLRCSIHDCMHIHKRAARASAWPLRQLCWAAAATWCQMRCLP